MSSDAHTEAQARRPLLADSPPPAHHGAQSPSRLEGASGTFTRSLGALEAFGIVISIVIGSGVFTSPGSIDTNVPSPGAALAVWLVGGLLAWTGATVFAELGTAIPGEGGVQPYLQRVYGDVWGYLAAWTWVVAVMPATLAILSIVFVESAFSAAGITDQADSALHKLLSVLVLIVMSVTNCISTKASMNINHFMVIIKFASILAVVLAGLAVVGLHATDPGDVKGGEDWYKRSWFAVRVSRNPDGTETDWTEISPWQMLGHYSAALYAALWAYSGWDKAIYISAEMSEPARQLPLAINSAIVTAIGCFLTANAAYYVLLPWDIVSQTDSIAVTAFTRLLGRGAGIVAAVFICIVVAGSLLGNSFVAARMTVAAANRGWLPSVLAIIGQLGPKQMPEPQAVTGERDDNDGDDGEEESETLSDAPVNAVVLSASLSTLYIIFGSFRDLLTLNGLGEYSFFFLTVLGAIILRYREPQLARPHKPMILFHLIFVIVSGFVVVRGAVFAPVQALVIVVVWVLGLVFYWVKRQWFS